MEAWDSVELVGSTNVCRFGRDAATFQPPRHRHCHRRSSSMLSRTRPSHTLRLPLLGGAAARPIFAPAMSSVSSSRYLSQLGLSDPHDPVSSLMDEHEDDDDEVDEDTDESDAADGLSKASTLKHSLSSSLAVPSAAPSTILGSMQPSSSSSSSSSSDAAFPAPLMPLLPQPRIITIVPKIQNLVCSVSLGLDVDPKAIAMRARNAEYNPKRFAACILRLREPKSTALLFRTGKLICAGARSIPLAQLACHKYTRLIQRLHYPSAACSDFTVINLVATVNTRFPIRLEVLAHDHGEWCSYEPELFPGLVYRVEEPKCVVLCFVSGKCVVTGAKSMQDVKRCVEFIFPILRQYSKRGMSSVGDTSDGASAGGSSASAAAGGAG